MLTSTTPDDRGILRPQAAAASLELRRYPPSPDLEPFVERHWIVRWDLPSDATHTQDVVGYPCVDLVLQRGRSRVYGVQRARLRRRYCGAGHIVGTKFRPGGFFPFFGSLVVGLKDRAISLRQAFGSADGRAGSRLGHAVCNEQDDQKQVALVEDFLRAEQPVPDPRTEQAARAVHLAMQDRTLVTVEALADRAGVSKRGLERLFRTYVGVSPKWVLRRFRLMEVAERANGPAPIEWAQVATELGYYDQAHFIRDFKTIVGTTPARYSGGLAP